MDALINPYANVNWSDDLQIHSISHAHSRVRRNDGQRGEVKQVYLDNAVAGGCQFVGFSNYYPSEPFYPLSDFFESVPEGIIGYPNAEHHHVDSWGALHFNGIGSTYSSGSPGGSTPVGIQMEVHGAFKAVLDALKYSDAGGITINHPGWTAGENDKNGTGGWHNSNATEKVLQLLDIDDRVLGMEIKNTETLVPMGAWDPSSQTEDGDEDLWDSILITGKRCWGFCVPDHEIEWGAVWSGRNILLVDAFDEHTCLQAYRNGNFYSKIFDSDMMFDNISFSEDQFSVSAPNATNIQVIVDGQRTVINGTSASVVIPSDATYVRAEAWLVDYDWTDRNGNHHDVTDKIYTNPIMFKAYTPKEKNRHQYEEFVMVMN